MVFIYFSGGCYEVAYDNFENFFQQRNLNIQQLTLYHQTKKVTTAKQLKRDSNLSVLLPLRGGKGGYGAKLKTEGGKKVRPNDNMFSRDTQGRKIAYSTLQRQYREFYTKKQEEDEKVKKQLADFKVMENTLKEEQSFMKLDRIYHSELQQTQKKLENSMKVGIQKYFQKKKDQEVQKKEDSKLEEKEVENNKQDVRENEKEDEQQKIKEIIESEKPQQQQKPKQTEKRQKNEKDQKNTKSGSSNFMAARQKLKSLFKK